MTIGNQPTDDIDKTFDWGAVAGTFYPRNVLQLVNNRVNNCASTQDLLIAEGHQGIVHVPKASKRAIGWSDVLRTRRFQMYLFHSSLSRTDVS
ncbi:hypothetical protein [Microcoleus sp. FACHB-672]|uniref:hypothetical protein n=1 Tax=Microcoleus sp. FACHB-672 TaxID=2692825 RepID=UPI0016877857|nr:hypothetical protein [Microcoleus sp. FACHB-672]MBD2040136.1 hypothetical protein [Microcoleus sp. FACHB-672]